jgi:hypothetical protein
LADRFEIPVEFTYKQEPIPSDEVNSNFAYLIAALNAMGIGGYGLVAPDDPVTGLVWIDTNTTPPCIRVYTEAVWRWTGTRSGTSEELPSNPAVGATYFDEDELTVSTYDGSDWISAGISGGTP